MKKSGTETKTVTTKMGDKYDVQFYYSLKTATREQPGEFEFNINAIYDEDGWEVTDTIDDATKDEIEELAKQGI